MFFTGIFYIFRAPAINRILKVRGILQNAHIVNKLRLIEYDNRLMGLIYILILGSINAALNVFLLYLED